MSRFFQNLRLDYIDWRLANPGSINRSHLVEAFDISMAIASRDITSFLETYPLSMSYDASKKTYVRFPLKKAEYQPRRPRPGLATAFGWK